jgi:hypothetical protein
MARWWKEPYTRKAAEAAGIHDFEGAPVLGDPDSRWIYYVEVCGFRFVFFSLEMLREYLEFYSHKILPSSRGSGVSPFSRGPAASVGDGQTRFERLPLRLRKERRRREVVKALERALRELGAEEQGPG